MAEIFVVRLSDEHEPTWVTVDASGQLTGSAGSCPLENLAAMVAQRKLVVLVPSQKVLLTAVNLPIRNPAKLRQALPYALEEQVAEDLDKLHFAAGRRGADGSVPAAVVRRRDLDQWLAALRAAGLDPAAIHAEQEAIPASPTATVWLIEGDTCMVRRPGEQPIVVEGSSVDDFLLFGDPRAGAEDTSAHLTVYLGPGEQTRFGSDLEALRDRLSSLDVKMLPGGAIAHLAAGVVKDPGVNLLQGAYGPRTGFEKLWRPWRAAAVLLLALVGVVIARDIVELFRLERMDAQLASEMDAVVQRIVNHRRQMESRLAAVRASHGGSDAPFLKSLEALSRAVGTAPGTRVESLSYRNGIMEVKVAAPSVDSLDAIQRSIAGSADLNASILSANPRGSEVEGRIQLSESGA